MTLERFRRPLATADAADSVRRLPIVDDSGRAIGIVTSDDLLVMLGRSLTDVCEGIENRSDATESC
jgi:CBS domain-containing protein